METSKRISLGSQGSVTMSKPERKKNTKAAQKREVNGRSNLRKLGEIENKKVT